MSWEKTHHLSAVIISSNNYVYNALSSSVGAAAHRWASRPPAHGGCCGFEGQLWSLSFRSSFMFLCQLSHQPALWSLRDTKCLTHSLTTPARWFTVCPWQMLADQNFACGMTLYKSIIDIICTILMCVCVYMILIWLFFLLFNKWYLYLGF